MNAPLVSDQPLLPVEEILHLSLPGILPAGEILAIFTPDGVAVRLGAPKREGQPPRLLGARLFTVSECCALVPLVVSYPHHCPYEVLLACYQYGATKQVTEPRVAACRQRLHRLLDHGDGSFEHEMRPIRNIISRVRLKLHGLGIDVTSMLETGYLLRPLRRRHRRAGTHSRKVPVLSSTSTSERTAR
ncbi:MAG: hypothetical protein H0W02_01910 [Ktedonobacteraceae bacterium]|nr:hypothetical protein [Ktedonobacteraceae bacterium]